MTEYIFTEVVLRHRGKPDKYFTQRGWVDFDEAARFKSQEDMVRKLLNEGTDFTTRQLLLGEVVKVVTRETIEDVEPLRKSYYNAVNVANDILNIQAIQKLPATVSRAYEAYHMRGGPKRNNYHYVMFMVQKDLQSYVKGLPDAERIALFEHRGWNHIYQGGLDDYLKCMLKPLGMKRPRISYWGDLILFKEMSDMVQFKLTYGVPFHTFDFKWIYEEYERNGKKSQRFQFDRKTLRCVENDVDLDDIE